MCSSCGDGCGCQTTPRKRFTIEPPSQPIVKMEFTVDELRAFKAKAEGKSIGGDWHSHLKARLNEALAALRESGVNTPVWNRYSETAEPPK